MSQSKVDHISKDVAQIKHEHNIMEIQHITNSRITQNTAITILHFLLFFKPYNVSGMQLWA